MKLIHYCLELVRINSIVFLGDIMLHTSLGYTVRYRLRSQRCPRQLHPKLCRMSFNVGHSCKCPQLEDDDQRKPKTKPMHEVY